jgi:hypothetical protein
MSLKVVAALGDFARQSEGKDPSEVDVARGLKGAVCALAEKTGAQKARWPKGEVVRLTFGPGGSLAQHDVV